MRAPASFAACKMACKDACAGLERMRSRITSDTMGLWGFGIVGSGANDGAMLCAKDMLEELAFEVLEALTAQLLDVGLGLNGFCALKDALDDAPELEALGMLCLGELEVCGGFTLKLTLGLTLGLVLQGTVEGTLKGTLGAPQELGAQRSLCTAELKELEELEELELHEVTPEPALGADDTRGAGGAG